ncbi:MAG: MFS transporter [Thermomicrobiales bacterium]|nr:MFS transporter [Thermomicrobiales bacterium]
MQRRRPIAPSSTELDASAPIRGRWLLLAIGVGTTLAPLNSTMIAVTLPNIQDDLNVSVAQTAWLVTLYLVCMAVGQPIGGRIGDLVGRRRVYLIGLVWFGIASAACALAPNLAMLIVFRLLQAAAGALTLPNGAAIIRQEIPAERRGLAFGVIGMMTALSAAVGPPLGGVLAHAFDWRAIFWVNVPIVAIALWLNARYLPVSVPAQRARTPFDWTGSVLFGLVLTSFIAIPTFARDDRVVLAVAAAVLSLGIGVFFVRTELRTDHPVVDMALFRNPTFSAACASIALNNIVMYTTLLAIPLFMDHVREDNERTIGLTLAAMSALAAVLGVLGGRMSDRRGRGLPAVLGAASLAIGTAALTGVLDADHLWPIALALAVMGVGIGLQSAPVQAAAVESAPIQKAGSAAGVHSTARYFGSVVGATVLALAFSTDLALADTSRFHWLFAGLSITALAGIAVNSRIAPRT